MVCWTWAEAKDQFLTWCAPAKIVIAWDARDSSVRVTMTYRGCKGLWDLDPGKPLPPVHVILDAMAHELLSRHGCCTSPIADVGLARRGQQFERWIYKYSRRFARRQERGRILWP